MIYSKFIKRLIDIILSLLVLVPFCWLYLILAILVRVKLGSPVIFKQPRPGKDGKVFNLYKFRTMTDAQDENGNHLPDEDRLIPYGKFLRTTSLDELPELINILKGDSIIPLEPIQMRRQAMALNMVKGVKYDVSYLIFNSNKDNEVKMDITLFEKEENDPKPNKTSFFFRPVKFEGKWYLTTKDNLTDRENGNTFDEEEDTEDENNEE